MPGKLALSLLSIGAAVALGWVFTPIAPTVVATPGGGLGGGLLADSDGDFLPDAVEWAVMTSSLNPDTDGDEISDFVEFVQKGKPRQPSVPLPTDQELRIVVTGPAPGAPAAIAWLHVYARVIGEPKDLTSFQTWLELPALPGLRLSFDLFAFGPCIANQRVTNSEGTWLSLSVPLASTQLLRSIAPFAIRAESTIAGRVVTSSISLFDMQGELTSLVPFGTGFAAQTISPQLPSFTTWSNRVCVVDLSEIGSCPGGAIYEVIAASCEDCNEVECGPACGNAVGWVLPIPGGLAGLTSGY